MKKALAPLFKEARGPTVEYDGLIVHSIAFRQVTKPGLFLVRFLNAVDRPLHGLAPAIDEV